MLDILLTLKTFIYYHIEILDSGFIGNAVDYHDLIFMKLGFLPIVLFDMMHRYTIELIETCVIS